MLVHELDFSSTATYVPFGVQESTLFIGKGENTVSIDLEKEQADSETVLDVTQDYGGTLEVGGDGAYLAVRVKIPPAQHIMVDTGKKDDKDKEVFRVEKVPVDIENVMVDLLPLYFPLEKEQEDVNND